MTHTFTQNYRTEVLEHYPCKSATCIEILNENDKAPINVPSKFEVAPSWRSNSRKTRMTNRSSTRRGRRRARKSQTSTPSKEPPRSKADLLRSISAPIQGSVGSGTEPHDCRLRTAAAHCLRGRRNGASAERPAVRYAVLGSRASGRRRVSPPRRGSKVHTTMVARPKVAELDVHGIGKGAKGRVWQRIKRGNHSTKGNCTNVRCQGIDDDAARRGFAWRVLCGGLRLTNSRPAKKER